MVYAKNLLATRICKVSPNFGHLKKKKKWGSQPNYPYFCDEILKHCLKSEYIELVLEMHTSKLTISDKKFTPYDLNLKKNN